MTRRLQLYLVVPLAAASGLLVAACASSHPSSTGASRGTHTQSAVLASNTSTSSSALGSGVATITTEGTGTVSGQPDTLTVGIGVTTTAADAATALQQNNVLAAAVQGALRHEGVPASDLQTTGLSLQQNWGQNGLDGYAVYDEVTATITDLAKAGTSIDDGLAPAGDAGRLDLVNLSFSDSNPIMAAARQQAVESARVQAQQMAAGRW